MTSRNFAIFTDGRQYLAAACDAPDQVERLAENEKTRHLDFIGVAQVATVDELARLSALRSTSLTLAGLSGEQVRCGTVEYWEDGAEHGLVLCPAGEQMWRVDSSQLPRKRQSLRVGTVITFTGNPAPLSGQKYPRAYNVRIATEPR